MGEERQVGRRPQDGKYDVVFPVCLPDEAGRDEKGARAVLAFKPIVLYRAEDKGIYDCLRFANPRQPIQKPCPWELTGNGTKRRI